MLELELLLLLQLVLVLKDKCLPLLFELIIFILEYPFSNKQNKSLYKYLKKLCIIIIT